MGRLALGIAVAVLIGLPGAAWAGPSLIGLSGLLTTPTAEVLGMTQWNVGGTAVLVEEGPDASVVYANAGIIPRLELGFAREQVQDGEAETLANAKLAVLGPLPGKISLAAGMMDVTDQVERSGYVVLSHTLGGGLLLRRGMVTSPQVHVGVGNGRFDGVFGGLSLTFDGRVEVMGEYDGEGINFGARWPIVGTLNATVAAFDGLDDYAVGLSLCSPW